MRVAVAAAALLSLVSARRDSNSAPPPALRARAPSAVEGGNLVGVFYAPPPPPSAAAAGAPAACNLWTISPSTGANNTVGPTGVCASGVPSWPTAAVFDAPNNRLLVAVSGAPAIYAVDPATGATTPACPVVYNESDPWLGLAMVDGLPYAVTVNGVWAVRAGGLALELAVALPGEAGVASGDGQLFVHGESGDDSLTVVTGLGSGAPAARVTPHTGVKGLWDLQYDGGKGTGKKPRLLTVAAYQLSAYDLATRKRTTLGPVPDGPGYPRVNALSPSGRTLAIVDFANVFTMDTVTGAVGPAFPFELAPRVVGYPQWLPAA